ncbi:MAG: hypothetical protein Q9157_007798 [Trypethelium eluteriae]
MSAADSSLRRNKPRIQLDSKQRQMPTPSRNPASSPGWLTPRSKKEKSKDWQPRDANRPVSAPSTTGGSNVLRGSGEQRLSPGKGSFLKADDLVSDKPRDIKKRRSDTRRLSQTPIRHVSDGPVLQKKSKWLSPQSARDEAGGETHGPLSYAEAALSSLQGPVRHVQTAPAHTIVDRPSLNPSMSNSNSSIQRDHPRQDSLNDESSAPPSIFDEEHDDTDRLSDFATEISSSVLSDHGLPPDIDPDERLVHPQKYLGELQDLEANVAGNSGLFLMMQSNRQLYPIGDECRLRFNFDCFSPEGRTASAKSYDELILDLRREGSMDGASPDALTAFHLLESRNLMLAIVSNIERMKNARFCQNSINVLTVDKARPQVARLTEIQLDLIFRLYEAIEIAMSKIARVARAGNFRIGPDAWKHLQSITTECENLLVKLKLPPAQAQVSIWRKAIMVLDLAVVSYCGAHTERFDEKFLDEDLDLAKITTAWSYDRICADGIMIRRRQLCCLDGFLGDRPVWVLQSQALWADSRDLYLSTDINQFADIWGPIWAVKPSEGSDMIVKYNAGPGSILACVANRDSPPIEDGEVLCHWYRHDEEPDRASFDLLTGSRLLIGASTIVEHTTSQLKENDLCTNHKFTVLQQLRQVNCVEELGTRKPSTYLAENQVSAQVGYGGVALGGARVYKRQHGISLKEAIIEAWRNGGGERNPAILAQWFGVEVSFCSRNARRMRLKQILNSTTMRNWLDACRNREHLPFDDAFDEALESRNPRAFSDLFISHREWRKDLGQLVSWCLEGLQHSSVDADRVLRVLWVPRFDQRYRIKIRHNPHSWTGLLTDTEEMCSMAIMSDKCLHTDYKDATGCQVQGAPPGRLNATVLETGIMVNEAAPRPKGLELRPPENEKSKQARWSINRVPRDEKFVLDTCRLRVIECFARTRLLVNWEAGVMKKLHNARHKVARTIGKEALYHWELKSEEDWPTKPIPLFVVSQFKYKR